MKLLIKFILSVLIFIFYVNNNIFSSDYLFDPPEYTNEKIEFKKQSTLTNIDKNLYFLEVSRNYDSFQELLSDNNFKIIKFKDGKGANFGYSKNIFYSYFRISTDQLAYLVIDYPPLDTLELSCYRSNGEKIFQQAGDNVAIHKWPINFRKPTFILSELDKECILSISGGSSLQLPMSLYTSESFNELKLEDSIVQSIYFGALFCILIYNLLITFFTKLRLYFVYCLFLAGYGLFQVNMLGIGYQFLWNQFPQFWIDKSVAIFLDIVIISAYIFMFGLLDFKDKNPKAYKIGIYLVYISLSPLFLFFILEYSILIKLIYLLLVLVIFFLLTNSIILSIKGDKLAVIYTVAWLVFLVGSLLFLLKTIGLINRNIITNYSTQVGSVIEFILLSIAMGYRINLMQSIISLNLEEQVIKRTNELKNEKEISEKALINLDRQNSMIEAIIVSKNSEELLSNINTVLNKNYNIKTFIIYITDEKNEFLNVFDLIVNEKENFNFLEKVKNNSIPINKENSTHGSCIRNIKSLYTNKLNTKYLCTEEIFNIEFLGINAIYIIPMIYEGKAFGTITFTDNQYFNSNIKNLNKIQRYEVQNFVKLISPSIYQYLQKTIIEKTLLNLQQTQSQLIEAERMASLGQLVGGVAHEINNPIGVIRSNSELISNNIDSILLKVPKFLDTLSENEKITFNEIVNESIQNKEFLTTKEERQRKKEIKSHLERILTINRENIDFITEQLLLLKLKSPYEYYINKLGESKFIDCLSIALIFTKQFISISNIEVAVEKASRVVFALRSYLNTELFLEKKEVDLIVEIEKSLHLYDNYIIGKINIKKDFPEKLKYNCIAENLSMVWKNIIFNAIQAMYLTEKYFELQIQKVNVLPNYLLSMRSSLIIEDFSKDISELKGWILIKFLDSGIGIQDDSKDKIFTPFFTTKALGEGIGLGLYVSKKIVHEHGGRIYFNSENGNTNFIVALPI